MRGKHILISPALQFTFIPTENKIFVFIFQVTFHGLKTAHNEKSGKKKIRVIVHVNGKITIFIVLFILKWEDVILWAEHPLSLSLSLEYALQPAGLKDLPLVFTF